MSETEAPPSRTPGGAVTIRPALPRDARAIRDLVIPYAQARILLAKEMIGYYEAIQEFVVAEVDDGAGGRRVVGCGALHVMWSDLGEVRTLAVDGGFRSRGIGHLLLMELLARARALGLSRVFCLTFEVEFFTRHGFEAIEGAPVEPEVFAELVRSHDDGVAEFLDLAHVKQNTLGNTRMLLTLA
ncbi:GCN5-related protein N-acetyltransferase [Beutenbergia cavernae DSM 12333]|uniref:GCN5-related protein N-acetyltransferase n=1 Tax=Beutenbergia cavernae (strain ATCC BAA-8 / DSM 12333 / CCUG 43141 / JCM 11478 / NBRC 16432 / NCIMB 13614 / HKI 0122) TaxID=471853 RepID=C5C1C0_BEUC1|nr:amino-acid N-acetyltransferase [Beutenbergia cavernae]ACQ81530.1 GCN5-related protein N-acetyltransferase [Beutenbergia cavernae DSM 12333]